MCARTPIRCPECGDTLWWAAYGAAVCLSGDHSVWLAALPLSEGQQYVTQYHSAGRSQVMVQTECQHCAPLPSLTRDIAGQPGPIPGTVWVKARDLKPGMRVLDGTGHSRSDAAVETGNGEAARTRVTFVPTGVRGDRHPGVVIAFADSPKCVEALVGEQP